jgi:N-acetylglucosaminyl-diphospho-decaprenol L-rhamnosyltransferase
LFDERTDSPSSSRSQTVKEGGVLIVVVTNRASADTLERCVVSIAQSASPRTAVLIDNGTHAADPALLSNVDKYIKIDTNDGFAAAVNVGARMALRSNTSTVAVLNDDTYVEPAWLARPLELLAADPTLGAVQPKLLLSDRGSPTINSLGVELDRYGQGHDIGYGQPDDPTDLAPRPIDIFTGGAVVFSAAFLRDVGGFDERFFLYYEDIDLALRGRARGWHYVCDPSSVVHHVQGASTSRLGNHRIFLQERNRLWCAFRHGSARLIVNAVWLSVRRLRHEPRATHAKALLHGVAGGVPRLVERRRAFIPKSARLENRAT